MSVQILKQYLNLQFMLVSAWLFHSNDPIDGNGKKNDHYWGAVHGDY